MSENAFVVTDGLGTLIFNQLLRSRFFCLTFPMKHINVLFKFQMQNHYIFVGFQFCMEGDFSVLPLDFWEWRDMKRSWGDNYYYDYQGNINKFIYKWSRLFTCNMVKFFRI